MDIRKQYMHLIEDFNQNNSLIAEIKSEAPQDDVYCGGSEVYLSNIIDESINTIYDGLDEFHDFGDILLDLNSLKQKLNSQKAIVDDCRLKVENLQSKNQEINEEFKQSVLKDYPQLENVIQIEISAFDKININGQNIYDLIKKHIPHLHSYIKYKTRLVVFIKNNEKTMSINEAFDFISSQIPLNIDNNIKGVLSVSAVPISLLNEDFLDITEDIINNL